MRTQEIHQQTQSTPVKVKSELPPEESVTPELQVLVSSAQSFKKEQMIELIPVEQMDEVIIKELVLFFGENFI